FSGRTAGGMTKKMRAIFQQIRAVFQSKMPKPVGQPEVDLLDPEESFVPDLSAPKPEPEVDLLDPEVSFVPGPSAPKPEPEVDLLDTEVSCVPDPSAPKPEPELNLVDTEQSCIPEPEVDLDLGVESKAVVFLCRETATDRDVLQEMCITHILNAAAPKKDLNYFLGTYYRGLHINYYSLPTTDRHCSDISKYFMPAAKLIDKALDKRVLICCKQGVDHSATLFLAFLMICHDMMVEDAIDHVIKSRRIRPSRDFLKKLMLLNKSVKVGHNTLLI
uniref:Tyrosine-protein phosphatase domain-containing protein n=1 Tax=Sinocyclocheilus grahami TaxID=75366 RepID=A0A672Q2A7_SINGR